mmetsp:Transcript_16554/g.34422  ORF Transcript_16554/g.34422 Transcript_16554/m.34422 type:complete len:190 (-) Transcript_16554:58-627(-)
MKSLNKPMAPSLDECINSLEMSSLRCDDDNLGNGLELLVDWPSRNRDSPKKKVRFSDSCRLRLFSEDYSYSKSYSKEERKLFSKRALIDAHKIRNALASRDACASSFTLNRLETCGIRKEELIGLENLTLEKSPADIVKVRSMLKKAVLLEQEKQRLLSCSDENRLAELSCMMSGKSGKRARRWAAIAA